MDTESLILSYGSQSDASSLLGGSLSSHILVDASEHDEGKHIQSAVKKKSRSLFKHRESAPLEHIPDKYAYMFRPKSWWELVLISGTVCGLEFCYSAETAFVTPILLSLGLDMKFVTMIWCLSPLIGLFVTPVLGSMSDSCMSRFGRRRPFILMYSIGIILGLVLIPNGYAIGHLFGDSGNLTFRSEGDIQRFELIHQHCLLHPKSCDALPPSTSSENQSHVVEDSSDRWKEWEEKLGVKDSPNLVQVQTWSIVFTAIGTVLLDFCSDACQSPTRTYVLDVSLPEDHTAGLSTFALMAGLGGSLGYVIGAVNWEDTLFGKDLGSQINVVFTLVGVVFIACLLSAVCNFPEIPLSLLSDYKTNKEYQERMQANSGTVVKKETRKRRKRGRKYGATDRREKLECITYEERAVKLKTSTKTVEKDSIRKVDSTKKNESLEISLSKEEHLPPTKYLKSIVLMPTSIKILCLTDLFCWMSLLCYSLFFTDFVGSSVFEGNPLAPMGSEKFQLYTEGVRFGCWGMAVSSLSCAFYSLFIEKLVKKVGCKKTYIGGQLAYFFGMVLMAVTRHRVLVIVLSTTTGVMYATLFTMPYILLANYHSKNQFSDDVEETNDGRGMGTDIATVSSMVFLGQFILSLSMGAIVEAVGSTVTIVWAAVVLSGCAVLCSTKVTYLNI